MAPPHVTSIDRFRLAAALITAVASLAGCQRQDRERSDSATRDSTLDSLPPVVTLIATDYAFQTPDTLAAGWTTFNLVNHGREPHMAQLIRLDSGMTVTDFLGAYAEAFQTAGPRPEWGRRLGGPTVAVPDDTTNATLSLEPGSYLWICLYNLPDGVPHVVGHDMAAPFVVRSSDATPESQRRPRADNVMRLVEYGFNLDTPITVGRQVIRVENEGTESHEVGILRLAPGKTMEDFQAWMRNPGDAAPEATWSVAGGVTSLAPGTEAYFEVDLSPGEYVLLCFVTAPDGRSHVDHGMIQQIRVG